jgi:hypothetical protein
MTPGEFVARDAGELIDAIVERHGGRERLSVFDREVVAAMVRVFNAIRTAEAADLPRLADVLCKLDAMLALPRSRSPLQTLDAHIADHHGAN